MEPLGVSGGVHEIGPLSFPYRESMTDGDYHDNNNNMGCRNFSKCVYQIKRRQDFINRRACRPFQRHQSIYGDIIHHG